MRTAWRAVRRAASVRQRRFAAAELNRMSMLIPAKAGMQFIRIWHEGFFWIPASPEMIGTNMKDCEGRSDEAIQNPQRGNWNASLWLAMSF
jgi:hypothetical protein